MALTIICSAVNGVLFFVRFFTMVTVSKTSIFGAIFIMLKIALSKLSRFTFVVVNPMEDIVKVSFWFSNSRGSL